MRDGEDGVVVLRRRLGQPFGLGDAQATRPQRGLPQEQLQEPTAEQHHRFGGVVAVVLRHLEPAEVELADEVDHGEEQLVLALEVRVERALRRLGPRGHHVHRGALEAHLEEDVLGRLQDVLPQLTAAQSHSDSPLTVM